MAQVARARHAHLRLGAVRALQRRRSSRFDEAIRNADSANELRLNIKLKSKRGEPAVSAFGGLSIDPVTQPADLEERAHQKMVQMQESRRRFEEEQLKQLREKKRQAEAAAAAAVKAP